MLIIEFTIFNTNLQTQKGEHIMLQRLRDTLADPDGFVRDLWHRTPAHIRTTFFSAAAVGLATHLYAFTNKFANHDDLYQLFRGGYGVFSGRWLLPTVLRMDGSFSIPWLIGLLGILFLSLGACLVVSLLRIRRPLGCLLAGALLVSFPSVTATLGYLFTSDAYFFGLLLAELGAWAALRRGWWGSALGAALICLSLGVYQSYLPVAAALMVGALLLETLDGGEVRALLWKALRCAGTLALGLALYLLVVRLTTLETGLTDYEGISEMGKLPLARLPEMIHAAYRAYISFFLEDVYHYQFRFLKYLLLLTGAGSAVGFVWLLWQRRPGPGRTILALALAALYPLAGGLIYVMVPNGAVHTHMLYGLVFALLAPISLTEQITERPRLAGSALRALALLSLAFAVYGYAVTANSFYLKLDMSLRECTAWSNRLIARIESCPGYEPGMDVVLVGSEQREAALYPSPEMDVSQMMGMDDLADLRTAPSYDLFLRHYLAFAAPVHTGHTELAQSYAGQKTVQQMPLYPREGSVKVLDGALVVKLNEAS